MAFSLATAVKAGSPHQQRKRIEVIDILVVHPKATYATRVSGESTQVHDAAGRYAGGQGLRLPPSGRARFDDFECSRAEECGRIPL